MIEPMPGASISLPPIPMRRLVGPVTDDIYDDNPTGEDIWGPLDTGPLVPGEAYKRVFNFGCGCGCEAHKLLLQRCQPKFCTKDPWRQLNVRQLAFDTSPS
jgi:hypothetical protein